MLNRILILSPHTDDGEISAGGTIAKFVEEGKDLYYIAFSSCDKSLPNHCPKNTLKKECIEATSELGIPSENVFFLDFEVRIFSKLRQEILDKMLYFGQDIKPNLVIVPSSFDTHQDHNVIYNESIRAFKKKASIWGMEHPWNNLSFRTDIFIKLEENHLNKKMKALRKYDSQSFKDYFKEEYILSCASTRGMPIGCDYAEVFECIRMNI